MRCGNCGNKRRTLFAHPTKQHVCRECLDKLNRRRQKRDTRKRVEEEEEKIRIERCTRSLFRSSVASLVRTIPPQGLPCSNRSFLPCGGLRDTVSGLFSSFTLFEGLNILAHKS
jgi:hypothetical protein